MCISKFHNSKCKMLNRSNMGRAIRGVLTQAKVENRLISGLLPAITYLQKASDDTLMCLLPETRKDDATAHMQTVLLQAFCYENFIPVIKVDSSEKLAEMCGISGQKGCPCVLITRDLTIPWDTNYDPPLTNDEQILADFYECTLEEYPTPVVQMPI
ncbi:PREDICTED: growth arrest and DNA damage-inducible protein GADD45 beta [Nicrophorus vespilloides]|uniref:Growth arrest and DNA damage-inducible protein GADD45 beta n=1 Tax=Nicrophorus vespilloides TaxID=110193 RepID=A0ABM1NH39_NICVS|nr:PREDICTED: growth arrest and DNA damage-inducible protein GADD45 beta [Nicrophorus vespilloides]